MRCVMWGRGCPGGLMGKNESGSRRLRRFDGAAVGAGISKRATIIPRVAAGRGWHAVAALNSLTNLCPAGGSEHHECSPGRRPICGSDAAKCRSNCRRADLQASQTFAHRPGAAKGGPTWICLDIFIFRLAAERAGRLTPALPHSAEPALRRTGVYSFSRRPSFAARTRRMNSARWPSGSRPRAFWARVSIRSQPKAGESQGSPRRVWP